MNRAQRLAVRIPFIGWKAHISSERLEDTQAKIANMSTGGAYLITEAEYEPGSIVTLRIRSSQMSFFVKAKVLRNDPFGIAVYFLDLCESTRNSILEIITRFLSRGKPEKFVMEKNSTGAENDKDMGELIFEQKQNLRSCPFCGAAEFGDKGPSLRISSTTRGHFAVLCRCGTVGPMRESEKRAITVWNTRNDSERHSIEYRSNLSENSDLPTLKGNLKSLDFPVILQILSSANKTGVLHLYQGKEVRKIYFRDGKIVAANGREALRLGKIGCGKGIISQEQLQRALVEATKTERQMGEVLLALQYITEGGLKELVSHQIREIVLEIFLWEDGNFEYRDYPVTFNEQGTEHIDTMRIILEAVARKDERTAA